MLTCNVMSDGSKYSLHVVTCQNFEIAKLEAISIEYLCFDCIS
jgi:hypothetical protein